MEGWPDDPWLAEATTSVETGARRARVGGRSPLPWDRPIRGVREVAGERADGIRRRVRPRSGPHPGRRGRRVRTPAGSRAGAHVVQRPGPEHELAVGRARRVDGTYGGWATLRASWRLSRQGQATTRHSGGILGLGAPLDQQAVVEYQYVAACSIMQQVAEAIGPDAMREVGRGGAAGWSLALRPAAGSTGVGRARCRRLGGGARRSFATADGTPRSAPPPATAGRPPPPPPTADNEVSGLAAVARHRGTQRWAW